MNFLQLVAIAVCGLCLIYAYLKWAAPSGSQITEERLDEVLADFDLDKTIIPDELSDVLLERGQELHVVGTAHNNDDGTPRQLLISRLEEGHMVKLLREPANKFDHNSIAVKSVIGIIGYVSAERAAILAPQMDHGKEFFACISTIAGGPENDREFYGVWIRAIDVDLIKELDAQRPLVS